MTLAHYQIHPEEISMSLAAEAKECIWRDADL